MQDQYTVKTVKNIFNEQIDEQHVPLSENDKLVLLQTGQELDDEKQIFMVGLFVIFLHNINCNYSNMLPTKAYW